MKYFIHRIILFSLPIIIYILVAVYIDPYNIIRTENNAKLNDLKAKISAKLNYPLYKLQKFSNNPTEVILLGDSRTDKLNTLVFDSITKKRTSNLAYGGGTISEIIETFWYATAVHDIKEVYIGLNFNLYNKNNNMNRVNESIKLKDSPTSYLFSKYCFKSTFLIIRSLITKEIINIEKPNFNKIEFWKYQLESTATNFYKNYQYPTDFHNNLIEISAYCRKKNIKLTFFVPPTHTDLQDIVNEFGLETAEIRFKKDLDQLGLLYDFDYPNNMTENENNFTDPFHYKDSIANIIINEIVTDNISYARTNNWANRK